MCKLKLLAIGICFLTLCGCVSVKHHNPQFKYEVESVESEYNYSQIPSSTEQISLNITEKQETKRRLYYRAKQEVCAYFSCKKRDLGWKKDKLKYCQKDKNRPCYKTSFKRNNVTAQTHFLVIEQVVLNCDVVEAQVNVEFSNNQWVISAPDLDLTDAYVNIKLKKKGSDEGGEFCINCNQSLNTGCML